MHGVIAAQVSPTLPSAAVDSRNSVYADVAATGCTPVMSTPHCSGVGRVQPQLVPHAGEEVGERLERRAVRAAGEREGVRAREALEEERVLRDVRLEVLDRAATRRRGRGRRGARGRQRPGRRCPATGGRTGSRRQGHVPEGRLLVEHVEQQLLVGGTLAGEALQARDVVGEARCRPVLDQLGDVLCARPRRRPRVEVDPLDDPQRTDGVGVRRGVQPLQQPGVRLRRGAAARRSGRGRDGRPGRRTTPARRPARRPRRPARAARAGARGRPGATGRRAGRR